jgi:hypothetical protein
LIFLVLFYILDSILEEPVVGVRRYHQAIAIAGFLVEIIVSPPPSEHAHKNDDIKDVGHP